jgi:hypothetical protein
MIDFIEQRADVVLQDPVELPAALAGDGERIMRGFAWPVAVGVGVKHRLK